LEDGTEIGLVALLTMSLLFSLSAWLTSWLRIEADFYAETTL
jgi:hypothetical protein